jgi:aldose 1-epimerase
MFTHEEIPFGKYTKHIIANEPAGYRLEVIPEVGTCVTDLTVKGVSVLNAYQTPAEVDFNRWYKNLLLMPFPNRMKDGKYEWGGQKYYFFINDPVTDSALHGFVADKPMTLEKAEAGAEEAMLQFSFTNDTSFDAYPFPFRFIVTYRLSLADGFELELKVENTGDTSIPVGLGWHPYFQLSDKADAMVLQLPPCQMVGVDSQMLPTGKRYDYDDFEQPKKVGATILDNCFALEATEGRAEVILQGSRGTMRYWQETGPGQVQLHSAVYAAGALGTGH